ncbi:MAG: energy-coupling factor transporter ATPase, partial [Oscillospiraceae bacterium]|nr:energy-coupling factor transporter ATPase [Oscillospiraceae bacterium]
AMLDPQGRKEVVDTAFTLCRAKGMTVVFITHHMDECIDADRLLVMSEGRIIADGKPAEVFADLALMEREGLSVPETTRLLHDLRAAGLPLTGEALDVEGCAGEIAAALGPDKNKETET